LGGEGFPCVTHRALPVRYATRTHRVYLTGRAVPISHHGPMASGHSPGQQSRPEGRPSLMYRMSIDHRTLTQSRAPPCETRHTYTVCVLTGRDAYLPTPPCSSVRQGGVSIHTQFSLQVIDLSLPVRYLIRIQCAISQGGLCVSTYRTLLLRLGPLPCGQSCDAYQTAPSHERSPARDNCKQAVHTHTYMP
jgi:hypothetical protein